MNNRELLFSVSHKDCEMQTFRSGGSGGQNQNKRNSGVRFIHHPSGARGESREFKSQLQNKKAAFVRMGESKEFKIWARKQAAIKMGLEEEVKQWVEEQMHPKNLLIEVL